MGVCRHLQPGRRQARRADRHALSRAGRSGTSRLGYATSPDGIHFTRRPEPVLSPEADYERDGGIEDPRLVKIDGTYYLTYTGYNKKDAQLCLATSTDLVHWDRKGVILPAYEGRWNVGWTKSGAIVPEKIDGKYWMYFLGTAADKTDQMGLAYSQTCCTGPTRSTSRCCRGGRPFDSRVVEPGPPPIVTPDAIVLIYNGADDALVYRTGVVRFDRNDPRRVLSRTEAPVFAPEADWEKVGQVPNVVFVEGMVPSRQPLALLLRRRGQIRRRRRSSLRERGEHASTSRRRRPSALGSLAEDRRLDAEERPAFLEFVGRLTKDQSKRLALAVQCGPFCPTPRPTPLARPLEKLIDEECLDRMIRWQSRASGARSRNW